jgi:hypothetical protein
MHSYLALETVVRNVSLSYERPRAVRFYNAVVMSTTPSEKQHLCLYVGPDNWLAEFPTSPYIAASCDLATMNYCILSLGDSSASEFMC